MRSNRNLLGPCAALLLLAGWRAPAAEFRPPAVPLVTHDPYFSIWSAADALTDAATTHWTGKPHRLNSLVRVDGQPFRLLGNEPADCPALPQVGLDVLPTRTICRFANDQLRLTLTFTSPLLPADLDVLSRPVTYLTWELAAADGRPHAVQLYFDAGVELAVNTPDQPIHWDHPAVDGLVTMRVGHSDQPVLQKKGDDLRIDWGYAYVAIPGAQRPQTAIGAGAVLRGGFLADGKLPYLADAIQPRRVNEGFFVLAAAWDLGSVGAEPVARWGLLAYDDRYSVKYFSASEHLRPYWRRGGAQAADLLQAAARDYATLSKQCREFDEALLADLTQAGGEHYARLCALAYRQTLAGNKLVADANGKPLLFPKENFSNGCIGTVDVLSPQAPFFLLFSPTLVRAMLIPVLDYASTPRWKHAYAPHDLGTYPFATGQVYGGGERTDDNQMPVEECGNMLFMLAALAKVEGRADLAEKYWPLLTRWADYLVANGLDPANQLCTADMFGHLAHNADLSLKAIVALGGYAQMAGMLGQREAAEKYQAIARDYAARWLDMARDEGRTRLAFDRPGTWGMKHNVVWDQVLGLNLFPPSFLDQEVAWYQQVQNPYGLPCDNRTTQSLLDWAVWSFAAARDPADFAKLFEPLYRYAHQTPDRVPLSDWFDTQTAKRVGFQARPVVGGIYARMLLDQPLWKRWAGQGEQVSGEWAPLPLPPALNSLVPTAEQEAAVWRYAFDKPVDDWFRPEFDDGQWLSGKAGFGTRGTPNAIVGTVWNTPDIWLRRQFHAEPADGGVVWLRIHHDEDTEVYLNGQLIGRVSGWTVAYEDVAALPIARAALQHGTNTLAVHCHQTYGGQYIDVGLSVGPESPAAAAPVSRERNPLLPGYFADPSLCCVDGQFWIYATTDCYGWEAGPFVAWKSQDLVQWSFRGLIYPEIAGQRNWAPSSLVKRHGKYYLFFSKQLQIHVAVADSPEGPFRDALGGQPLVAAGFRPTQSIDSEVLIDDDGQAYLYWGGGPTYVVKLKPDLLALDGEPVRIPTNEKFGYVEGPFPFKRQGKYYLTGAASGYHNYHVIYGISDSPLGPFTFPDDNPLTLVDWEAGVWGPGHGSVLNVPGSDDWYLCYLRDFPREVVSPIPRQVAIDRLEFYDDGRIKPVRLTRAGVPPREPAAREEVNLALGQAATASTSGGGQFGNRDASAAVDGTFATRWVAATAEPEQWCQVDLGQVRDIARCELFLEFPTKTYRYRLEHSLDGQAWSPYADSEAEQVFRSPHVMSRQVRTRYLRVVFAATEPAGTLPAIWEFRVFSSAPTPEGG